MFWIKPNGLIYTGDCALEDRAATQSEIEQWEHSKKLPSYIAYIQKRLDDFAKTRNYDNILSATTYATDTNQKFASEGQYCVMKRGETWAKAYEIMDSVMSGEREMPTNDQLDAELPQLEWPQ